MMCGGMPCSQVVPHWLKVLQLNSLGTALSHADISVLPPSPVSGILPVWLGWEWDGLLGLQNKIVIKRLIDSRSKVAL